MRDRLQIIALSLLALLVSRCDSAQLSEWVTPKVRVSLLSGAQSTTQKASALLEVELRVRSSDGRDFSPEPVTVDNTTATEVAFEVSLPADSVYSFEVIFSDNGVLVGEGATIQEVTLETAVVDISVFEPSSTSPSVAFIPSQVRTTTGSGNIEIKVRYYGFGQAAAGLAALLEITGPTPRTFSFDGPELNFVDGRELNAAWQFEQDLQGVQDIGTLVLSRGQTADFCLESAQNQVRIVSREGVVTPISLTGACISVIP